MKKALLLILLLPMAFIVPGNTCRAQTTPAATVLNVQTGQFHIYTVGGSDMVLGVRLRSFGVPIGTCITFQDDVDVTNNNLYFCGGDNAWHAAAGSATNIFPLNNTWTGTNAFAAISATSVTDSTLTSGNCVQAGTSGLLTTTSSACGAGSGAFAGGLGGSFQDVTEIAAPANPAAGNDRLFLNSTTHLLDCHTSTGASCAPSGSTTLGTITPQPAAAGDVVCANSTPTWTDCKPGIAGRTVSGTTDTIVAGDRGTTIAYTAATAVGVSVTSAATLGNNPYFTVNVQGAGTVTLTPGAGQINGAASLAVTQGQTCYVHSPDNVNYTADCANGQITWSTGLTATPTAHGVTVTASGGGAAVINGVSCGTCNLGTLNDTNGNSTVLSAATTSAVNQITVTNAATGGIPSITSTGTDTNIPLNLDGKGTGTVNFPSSSVLFGGATTATASAEISSTGVYLLNSGGRIAWSSSGTVSGSLDNQFGRLSAGLLSFSGGTAGDLQGGTVALERLYSLSNNGTTATVLNELAIASAGTATVALTSSTHGVLGVVMSGAGTSGHAGIAVTGNAKLIFDAAITQGDWFVASVTTAGNGHDSGTASTAAPVTGCLGQILAATNATPGSTPQAVWLGCQ